MPTAEEMAHAAAEMIAAMRDAHDEIEDGGGDKFVQRMLLDPAVVAAAVTEYLATRSKRAK